LCVAVAGVFALKTLPMEARLYSPEESVSEYALKLIYSLIENISKDI
jgi:hypothetical protein